MRRREQLAIATATAAAPRSVVWTLLSDGTTWPSWAPFDRVELERPGIDHPWGRGAVRRITSGRVITRERIEVFEPERRVAYTLLEGLPLEDYRGEVVLRDTAKGTEIVWRSRFTSPYPAIGRLVRWRMQRFLADLARRLAAASAVDGDRAASV